MPRRTRHDERVRERFTRTAQAFASFSLTTRSEEAEQLLALAWPHLSEPQRAVALDVACGPGTFTKVLAQRFAKVFGLDLTLAQLEQARAAIRQSGLQNISLSCGDATALPFPDKCFALVACGYGLHHMPSPRAALSEMARVARPDGVVALVDIIVPAGADPEFNNRIERTRDASHARTLTTGELLGLLEWAGLKAVATEPGQRVRSFDDWMRVAGWQPGAEAYRKTRALMESDIEENISGFRPRMSACAAGEELVFTQTSLFLVARRPG
jgi:ubiquinone/menaquinone biosynthesis C-methylase UbiE